jgi:CheY-like chemotaxis protein
VSTLRTILVIDDDIAIRTAVSWALEDVGYDVTLAEHGRAALDHVTRRSPDLVLLDMRMPVMDGWEFARQYRALPSRAAPIVVMTAAQDVAERASQITATDYIAKPFVVDDLLAVVGKYLAL